MKEFPLLAQSLGLDKPTGKLQPVATPPKSSFSSLTLSPQEIMKRRLLAGESFGIDSDLEDAFYVCDLGDVMRQQQQFKRLLPRIEPFYAMKCCPDPQVMGVLNQLGTGFDCASKGEIEAVVAMGVDPSRIIYANPCKPASHLRYAAAQGVRMMTFDNEDELRKIKKHHATAQLVLRVLTDDSRSLCKLGLKFGAALDSVPRLLQVARELSLEVIGVSFHVGSGCYDAAAFGEAVVTARKAFDLGEAMGFRFSFLDVGGGFPGHKARGITFPQIAAIMGPLVDQLFPPSVRVIAEPGRFYVSAAFSLALNITSRRVVRRDVAVDGAVPVNADTHPQYMYYVNDGMYGSFNCLTFDHATVHAQVLLRHSRFVYGDSLGKCNHVSDDSVYASDEEMSFTESEPLFKSSVWGPTCDSIDCIGRDVMLPELDVGDWLVYEDMGAYTMTAASTFNGFAKSAVIYTSTL